MKTIVTVIALLSGVNMYCQKSSEAWCRWYTEGSDEVNLPAESYGFFKKGNFYYYLANDEHDLFIDLKIEDSGVQYKVLQEGLNVWINADGKSLKKTGIRFPVGVKYSKGPMMRPQGNNLNPESPVAMANTIELIGFSDSLPKFLPAEGGHHFFGSVKYNKEGNLYYNLRIPLNDINLSGNRDGSQNPEFSIGIEYGAPPESANPQPRQTPPSQSSNEFSSSNARSGGSRGGGGRGGGRSSGAAMPMGGMSGSQRPQTGETSIILWVKDITIATQN